MEEVVAPLLHNNEGAGGVDESIEVPLQLFTTDTTGGSGIALGAAVPRPCALVQPFTVVFTQ